MAAIPINIADLVGGTPMVQLARLLGARRDGVELFGKLEAFNPGGIGQGPDRRRDDRGRRARRAASSPAARRSSRRPPATPGIALAFVCAARGLRPAILLPQGMSREREALLRLYGATVEVVESLGGMNEAVDAARALAPEPDDFLPDQFSNPANPEVHRRSTGPEIWTRIDGKVDVFVAGVGHRRDDHRRGRGAQGAQPEGARRRRRAAVERRCSPAARPGRTDPGDRRRASCPRCSTATCSTRSSRSPTRPRSRPPGWRASREGVLAGLSCGAALWGAHAGRRAARSPRGKRIACVLPDSGERYISAPFFAPQG